jgi:hypothetical protein
MEENLVIERIISLEKAALERWGNGDPSGFLEITSDDIVYFDPLLDKRVDGKARLSELYESLRGEINIDSFEMIDPIVQQEGI